MSDQELAEAVRAAMGRLNAAMRAADDAGLQVEVQERHLIAMGKRHALPVLDVTVSRPLLP
jgi:hypothetical protein